MKALLALDLGTSGCRAEVFDLAGRSLARCHREYGVASPEPGAAEQEADGWWTMLAECARAAVAAVPEAQVQAVGLSAQGHSWLPVDTQLRPLRQAVTWLDARSGPQARRLLEQYGAEFWGRVAGKLPGQWHMLPQLLWLREHDPASLEGASHTLCAHDFLIARLTGEVVTDYTNAATTLLFDIRRGEWAEGLLNDWDVDPALLPRVQEAGTVAGRLTAQAAAALGLPEGLPVAVGAQDQKCAALAAGVGEGTATASLGTATAVMALVARPAFSLEHGAIPCFPYLRRGEWVLEAPLATSGGALRWWRDVVSTPDSRVLASLRDANTPVSRADTRVSDDTGTRCYEAMVAEAEGVAPGSEGVLFFPYLAGAAAPFWHGDVRGSFCGLGLHVGEAHMTRALLESVAYDIRANLDCMRGLGCAVEELILFGGGARSALWPQIIAAVCGVPTRAGTESEAASRGAAMLAAQAVGLETELLRLQTEPVVVPSGWLDAYGPLYERYTRARQAYFTFAARLESRPMKILAISDIHIDPDQPEAWGQFLARAQDEQPDVIIVAGDLAVGKSGLYETLLSQFDFFSGPKLFVPGNHDVWQLHSKRATWQRYDQELPAAVSAGGWQYLDLGPVLIGDVAIVGAMGWYDYSLRQTTSPRPDLQVSPATVTAPRRGMKTNPARSHVAWESLRVEDYAAKALQVGDAGMSEGLVWNDVFYTDWQRSDAEMVEYFCDKLRAQAREVARSAKKLVAVTHFVPFVETLRTYTEMAPAYARAFSGSTRLGETILGLPHVCAAIFGHWHEPGKWQIGEVKAYNVAARRRESTGTLIRL